MLDTPRRLAKGIDQVDFSLKWEIKGWSLRGYLTKLCNKLVEKFMFTFKNDPFYSLLCDSNQLFKKVYALNCQFKCYCQMFKCSVVYKKTLWTDTWSFCLLELCQQKQTFILWTATWSFCLLELCQQKQNFILWTATWSFCLLELCQQKQNFMWWINKSTRSSHLVNLFFEKVVNINF